ncbi:MAG: SpoIIE family protein phosphatase [Treponema sp.]|nr:SpoIIE family protein phosphatase [Treponema sp.]
MTFQGFPGILIIGPAFLLFILLAFIAILRIREVILEGKELRLGAAALLRGGVLSPEKKKGIGKIKKRGIGLRLKLAFYTILLVLAVQLMVIIPLYRIVMSENRINQIDVMLYSVLLSMAAQTIGIIGAIILSTLLIRPIKKLVKHVENIRDTADMTKLKGVEIKFKSKDELAILGETINEMTQSLATAAVAASDLSIGKEIQKKFIPLDLDYSGNKLSSGFEDTKFLSIFGYYEGAKGVSGDYFDHVDLDGRYYAIIKCDVSGKGIPAAFIMIQVATMFLNYFKHWKANEKGMQIQELVYQINEFIEILAFKGRFAAFTLCLYDSETGIARFCNAGDNIVRIFDASEHRVKTFRLPSSPAAGVLTNFQVESKGGYSVQTLVLAPGDILLLYTDGIEEAKRKFRNSKFEEILCTEGVRDTPHANHIVGQGLEEFGNDRVMDIINAIMNKKVYSLKKWHNPEGEEKILDFDFSACEGTLSELILAMVSVEKIFRIYKDKGARDTDQVLVDKAIDSFLKDHFIQYRDYCYYTEENTLNSAYLYYTHLKEDEQYDDLTILGLMRK